MTSSKQQTEVTYRLTPPSVNLQTDVRKKIAYFPNPRQNSQNFIEGIIVNVTQATGKITSIAPDWVPEHRSANGMRDFNTNLNHSLNNSNITNMGTLSKYPKTINVDNFQ